MAELMEKEVCKEYRDLCSMRIEQSIEEIKRVTEKRLDDHSKQLDLLANLTERLVIMQETFSKQAEISEQRLRLLEKQVIEAEKNQSNFQLQLQNLQKESKKHPIWKEKWFGISVIICLIILAAIIGVAIGKDILSYVPLKDVS